MVLLEGLSRFDRAKNSTATVQSCIATWLNHSSTKNCLCRWEIVECAAGAPELSGATLPQGMTGPKLLRHQMDAAAAHNLTVMRFWVPGVSPSYALQTSPGVYNEGMLKGAVGMANPLQHDG